MSTSSSNPYSPAPEHRKVGRVRCSLPAAVVTPGDWPGARVLDISRTGVRLAMGLEGGGEGAIGLTGIVEQLEDRLALKLVVDLHPDRLGSLIRRALQVVRIGPVVPEEGIVELGCVFVPPLSEDDAVALGVPLPREGEPPDIARRRMGSKPPRSREPSRYDQVPDTVGTASEGELVSMERVPRAGLGTPVTKQLRVHVASGGGLHQRPLRGRALELEPAGGVLCLDDDPTAPLVPADLSLAERVLRFTRTYGAELKLTFEGDKRFAWAGRIRVESVGIMPEIPGQLLLGFSFVERPTETQQRVIGIAS